MKKITFILFVIGFIAVSSTATAAMSTSKVRKNTRFLTDRMAYELNLSPAQYDDIYEINFDFIYNIRYLMNDVMQGYEWALDDYYQLLDIRNDDLRWVLSNYQYERFLRTEYFYRPVYASENSWNFRIYVVYNNPNYFYFGKPVHYRSYSGGHYRTHYNSTSYYRNKYHHDVYQGQFSTKQDKVYYDNRHKDFGVSTRPSGNNTQGNSTRPNTNSRPSNGSRPNTSTRPSSSSTGSSVRPGSNSVRTESSSSQLDNNSSRPNSSSSQSGSSSSRPNSSSSRPSSNSSRSNSSSTQSKNASKVSERPSSESSRNSSSSRSNSSSSSRSVSERNSNGGRR